MRVLMSPGSDLSRRQGIDWTVTRVNSVVSAGAA